MTLCHCFSSPETSAFGEAGAGKPPAAAEAKPAEDLQLARGLEVLKSWASYDQLRQENRASLTPMAKASQPDATPAP